MKIASAVCALLAAGALQAQVPSAVSLSDAQQIALHNHPRIASAELTAKAGSFAKTEARAARYPTLSGNLTGVGAEHNSVVTAGAITTSSTYSRAASGLVATQLLTDFGRTAILEQSAGLTNEAQLRNVTDARARVLIDVADEYYRTLAAQSVLGVARATLELRQLTFRQVSALAQSALRSTLDVSFAQVNVSQAELELFRAENNARASHARLSAAMGYERDQPYTVADEPLPPPLAPDVNALITQALHDRPDLASLQLSRDALERYAQAEKALRNPTVTALAVAGVTPERDERLPQSYSAAGINVNIPVLNGGLFKARREAAEARAASAGKDAENLALQIARDVQVAWLDASDAFRRLDVTTRLVAEAQEAVRLAQARYDIGLGSIVELNQAQLNQTTAEIAAASAKYEYLSSRAALNYATGSLR